ncbi:MAG: DUF456 domain-containing protein [Desulfobacterales bacterium]|nr:DUF456 domain-containing protein [Desulfobacterales bacterium]
MTIILIILGLFLALCGVIGCILPVIPGPPISFLALIILSYAKNWEPFSSTFLIVMAGITILVTILDYVIPAGGAKKYGASKWGVIGAMAGILIGVFMFPPWGMVVGAFTGAFAGELLARKDGAKALQAGLGVFIGIMVGTGLKLAFSGTILFFYIKEIF